jgi:hypothetical protein
MCASLSHNGPVTVEADHPLHVRYALYVHRGLPNVKALNTQWTEFTRLKLPEPPVKKK